MDTILVSRALPFKMDSPEAYGISEGGDINRSYKVIGQQKAPDLMDWGLSLINSLTMTYFHTGCSTIIGAKSFHGPVRDGKGWYQLAIVIRHNL